METKTCLDSALKKLSYRMHTAKEILDYLKSEGYEQSEINSTMAYLEDMNYLDDTKYAAEFFAMAKRKKWADRRIVFELEQRGVDYETAKEAITQCKNADEYDGYKDDDKVALGIGYSMANEHMATGKTMDDKFFAKVGRHLQSLGYSQRTCYYVIDRLRTGGKAKRQEAESVSREQKKKETEALYYSTLTKNR